MMPRLALMLSVALAAGPALGTDAVSVGFKAGIPATEIVRTAGEIGGRRFKVDVSRFTIGPVVNIRLPKGFGFEAGAMYKRFEQQAGQIQVTAGPATPLQMQNLPYSSTGQSWEFPLLGQYRAGRGPVRPYLEAGVSFNSLRNVFAPFRLSIASPQTATFRPGGNSESRTGFVCGGGMEFTLPFGRLSPGVRFTHYGTTREWLPSTGSFDFLLGFTF